MDLSSKRIMLTDGAGFLGSFVTEKLKARGCKNIFIPTEQEYDLKVDHLVRRLTLKTLLLQDAIL